MKAIFLWGFRVTSLFIEDKLQIHTTNFLKVLTFVIYLSVGKLKNMFMSVIKCKKVRKVL